MEHPAADYAKAVMQVAAAGTGVRLSDGSTNIVPVGDTTSVRSAWDLHARLVRRSLERGFYQGWDLHPAQLPTRFGATYTFFRQAAPAAVDRLARYRDRRSSGVIDEPATAWALQRFLLRGLDCGALDPVGRRRRPVQPGEPMTAYDLVLRSRRVMTAGRGTAGGGMRA